MIPSNFATESIQIKYENLISLPIHTNIACSYIQPYMFGIPIKYYKISNNKQVNTLRTGSFKLFKLFKRPLPGVLKILTL